MSLGHLIHDFCCTGRGIPPNFLLPGHGEISLWIVQNIRDVAGASDTSHEPVTMYGDRIGRNIGSVLAGRKNPLTTNNVPIADCPEEEGILDILATLPPALKFGDRISFNVYGRSLTRLDILRRRLIK